MQDEQIGRVREFNRVVTQRIGVLSDQYLGHARALGAARVLWEIDHGGTDVRTIGRGSTSTPVTSAASCAASSWKGW